MFEEPEKLQVHDHLIKLLDSGRVFSRFTLMITLWMTWKAFQWGTEFASTWPSLEGKSGTELALVIAAVLTPITALQGFAFHTYTKGSGHA
jgi:hypothetical protein